MEEPLKVKDCIGCGFCCRKAPCSGAVRIYGNVTKCPALRYDGARYFCSLMELPGKLGTAYRKELGAYTGCCCGLNSDRQNIPSPEIEVKPSYRLSKDLQVFITALSHNYISGDAMYLACLETARKLNEPKFVEEVKRLFAEQQPKHMKEFVG